MGKRESSENEGSVRVEDKICNRCGELSHEFYDKAGTYDGLDNVCKKCRRVEQVQRKAEAAKRKAAEQTTDEIIHQIETGEFEVDQKWLLTEAIKQYKDEKCRDKLKALDMIMEISGYNKSNTDDRAVMDSLIESLNNGRKEDDTGISNPETPLHG